MSVYVRLWRFVVEGCSVRSVALLRTFYWCHAENICSSCGSEERDHLQVSLPAAVIHSETPAAMKTLFDLLLETDRNKDQQPVQHPSCLQARWQKLSYPHSCLSSSSKCFFLLRQTSWGFLFCWFSNLSWLFCLNRWWKQLYDMFHVGLMSWASWAACSAGDAISVAMDTIYHCAFHRWYLITCSDNVCDICLACLCTRCRA